MANCFICKNRMGKWGEDKYVIDDEHIACYKCAPLLRKIDKSDNYETVMKAREELLAKVGTSENSEEVKKIIEKQLEKKMAMERELKELSIRRAEVEKEYEQLKKDFLLTTVGNFEGYTIEKYISLVHAEVVLGTGFLSELEASFSDLLGGASSMFSGKMAQAKYACQQELIKKGLSIYANAIIGIDFDITTFSNNMIAVTATGTAVVVKKL